MRSNLHLQVEEDQNVQKNFDVRVVVDQLNSIKQTGGETLS